MSTILTPSREPSAHRRSLCDHRLIARSCRWLLSVVPVLLTMGCSGSKGFAATSITDGIWVGRAGTDLFCFEFLPADHDSLTGVVHSVRDGKKYSEMSFTRTMWHDPDLEIEIGATQVTYRGTVDFGKGRVTGSLFYADGFSSAMELRWADPNEIVGLRARPGTAAGTITYTYRAPENMSDGLVVGSIEDLGLPVPAVDSLVTAIIRGEAGVIHSLLVLRHDTLAVEEYFHGYGPDDLHGLASVTKSVSSLLVGAALDQGKIKSMDELVVSFFPETSAQRTEGWDQVTLRHLLTMSMGLDWSTEEAQTVHGTGPRFFDLVLTRRIAHEPGSRWNYVNADADLLSGILVHATGASPEEFARQSLFEPLGIARWDWSGMAEGPDRLMDGSLWLRPRDMAKIGMLVLNGGRWEGRQVVSEDWIHESTGVRIPTGEPIEAYGFLWWVGSLPSPTGLEPVILANGWGSQFIALFPAKDIVLVTAGANEYNGKHFALASLVAQYLLGGM